MQDLLNIEYVQAIALEDCGDHYRIHACGTVTPTSCPLCQSALYKHGMQSQVYMDTPMHGKRVLITLDRRRFRCKVCNKTLFDPLPAFDAKRLATNRLIQYVEQHCLKKTFADLAREIGVDEKTVRHIFDDYVEKLKKTVQYETPEVLGIDELKIVGQYRAMLTNIEKCSLFDMLQNRNKADLIAYFKKMPDKNNVQALTMDMWSVYRQVAHDQFPRRMIIADRFHVVRMATVAMESVRKAIRKQLTTKERLQLKDDRFVLLSRQGNLSDFGLKKLSKWDEVYPLLIKAYETKERFHNIYSHSNKTDAMKAANEWKLTIDPDLEIYFRSTVNALESWWEEIFNFYDRPVSNAYTESINNLAKSMNRMGRGYSFDVIRARLLYDTESRADTRTTIRKKARKSPDAPPAVKYFALTGGESEAFDHDLLEQERSVEYGPYIPTLVMKLQRGDFL
jgi:transposase